MLPKRGCNLCEEPLLHRARRPKSRLAPTLERAELHLLTFAHRAIYTWLEYLPLPLHDPKRKPRLSDTLQIAITMEKDTFKDSAAKLFNSLPANLRSSNDFHRFHQLVANVFEERAGLRLAEM